MNTQELTDHIKHLNEYPYELGQDKQELYELETALYDLAEYLEEARLG